MERSVKVKSRVWAGFFLAIILLMAAVIPAYATKKDIEDARKKAGSLEEEKKKVEATLKNLEGLKQDTVAYVRELDGSLSSLNQELEQLEEQIVSKEADIEQTREELKIAKEVESRQYEAMKLRIKYMYEQGETSYLDMLLQSKSMVQLMNRAEYIHKIAEYDRRKMDEYAAAKETVAIREAQLEKEHEELLTFQEQTEAKQQSVEILLAQKNQELKNFESQIDTAQGQISEYEKDIQAQENKVRQLEAELKRKEEEARKAAEAAGKTYNTVNLGDIRFIWPCPASRRITSGFGERSSPTEGASTSHQGIDIGAASGSGILAAASGTVVISTYSYSAGNYIMINHGGGVYTVYMHCSQLLALEGQSVMQGQTIAKVGSTGYSTGPHLHFGIRANGQYINPVGYVSP
ncbi:MAG: peptidoglycan DD-metalloendopeptidase family protein [Lachnospiraceae bacterium]|nr:peptidoglycan DD-metalloendopeptidase family protein [Lachnospiraceae bacterium]MCI9105158.1 peptidoglycan DD-metalloendopeptidase family protein [Lachnospiraceae bacterium]